MIGPDSQGGITSVIKMLLANKLDDYAIFLPSYRGKFFIFNICYFLFFLVKYAFTLIFNKNIRVVHIHFAINGSFLRKIFVLNIAKIFNKKVIFHSHIPKSDILFGLDSVNIINSLIQKTLNKADLLISLSSFWKNALESKCSNKNTSVIYNPVEIKLINEIKRDNQCINLLFMGRIEQRKGFFDLIEAAKLISNPDIKIKVYGDGEINKAKKLVKDNNLSQIVEIFGWISGDKVSEVYNNADIVVLPSYNEGLPMTLLEAAAYGLPIISTPVGGIPDIVTDGVNGFLIQPGDYKALAEKIKILANDKELRKGMGQESYKIACEKFDTNKVVDNLISIYNSLLQNNS